jgi:nicotinamide-nucleotide amidase
MTWDALTAKAEVLLQLCREKELRIVTAESCTGGLIAACLTSVPGSSDVVERGFVTYSNEAKVEMIGVPAALIAAHGAVSAEVAEAMAEGALKASRADLAVSVTGIAGPGGATPGKPLGLVYLGLCTGTARPRHLRRIFQGDRQAVRQAATATALELLLEAAA